MTASPPLPSTQLAMLQDQILSRTDYTPQQAREMIAQLRCYATLLGATHNSNLHARQAFILAGLYHLSSMYSRADFDRAMERTKPLFRDGYSIEGPDYCLYVQVAIDWFNDITRESAYTVCEQAVDNYRETVAPDGTIPVPEASSRTYPLPDPALCVSNDKYIIQRWPSGAYLLIDVGTECDAGNLHDWLSAGYFALSLPIYEIRPLRRGPVMSDSISAERMDDFEKIRVGDYWAQRCEPYTSFSWSNVLSNSALSDCLPPGALRPTWRLKPPRVSVVKGDSSVTVTWKYPWSPKIQRVITWSENLVRVQDQWSIFKSRVKEWRV